MSRGHKLRGREGAVSQGVGVLRLCEERGCRACHERAAAGSALAAGGARTPEQSPPARAPASQSVGVVVVDDDPKVRRIVLAALHTSSECHCCGCFSTAGAALEAIPRSEARIALVGLWLPDLCGIQLVHSLRLLRPGLRIVLMTAPDVEPALARRALAVGADECWTQPTDVGQCLEALRAVVARIRSLGPRVPLTAREHQILARRAHGLSWKAIADELGGRPSLVSKLRQRIFQKLAVHTSVAAVNKWRELGGVG